MSHYILEMVIPPTEDVEGCVTSVMNRFTEEDDDDDGECDWYDFWLIGGRFSGHKLDSRVTQKARDAFIAALVEKKITVSNIQFGKQEIQPASQIPIVDGLWRKMCPGNGEIAPMFKHSEPHLAKTDVCAIRDIPVNLECERIIICQPYWKEAGKLIADQMLVTSLWNGISHQKTQFDGRVLDAIRCYKKTGKYGREPPKHPPTDEWLVVTIDYHN